MEAIYAREKKHQQAENNNHIYHEGNRGTCSQNPFDGNDGNNTPPRTPRVTMGTCPSPPRQSHHENDEEVTSKDVIKFQKDDFSQKLMSRVLEENRDQYF